MYTDIIIDKRRRPTLFGFRPSLVGRLFSSISTRIEEESGQCNGQSMLMDSLWLLASIPRWMKE
jgi:hypothetical protein